MAKSWGYKLHEWRDLDQSDRDLLLAHDALVCPRCGNLRSVCSDPNIEWHPDSSACWPTAAVEWGQRRLSEKYKDAKPSPFALRPTDGVAVFPSLMPPEHDDFA